ncbi:MAG: response regulator [Chitinophagaceae bacterium]|nr:response regulator [Oligoflexus sp.]
MAEKWLVIDDSATIQRVIKLAFQDYDVQITEADSTQEALRELSQFPSSLVIVDAALAGVQSVHDFSRLQQTSPKSAFVILEGSYDHIDENQFRSAGFRYFLKKPFDAAQLIAITREALGRAIPHRFQDQGDSHALPAPFSLPEELRDLHTAPPPLPGMKRSLLEELENPFASDSFDLGLDVRSTPAAPQGSFRNIPTLDPFAGDEPEDLATENETDRSDDLKASAFTADQFKAKPYNPDRDEVESYIPENIHVGRGGFNLDDESFTPHSQDGEYLATPLSGMLEPMLQEEMGKLVRQAVGDYCRKHFAELAREFLGREIEKLTQERSRLLVDK